MKCLLEVRVITETAASTYLGREGFYCTAVRLCEFDLEMGSTANFVAKC